MNPEVEVLLVDDNQADVRLTLTERDMRILVAEDSKVYRRLISDCLKEWNFPFVVANDGLAAWELLQSSWAPTLALLDWVLPGLSGLELCQRIRARTQNEPYIYTVVLTAKNQRQDLLEAMDAGADDYLTKPFDPSELKARLLAGRRIILLQRELISARESLKLMNAELEHRVSLRTLELESANQQLVSEMRERETAEKQAEFLAYYDALTGLPNRTLLHDRMKITMASARRGGGNVVVLFLDLDNFKQVNDSLGHSTGDSILKEAANRLKKCTREQDTVARLGSDEFVVLLTTVKEAADAGVAAQRIVNEIATGFVIQDHRLRVTCSTGISIFPGHGTDMETLIKNAEIAMNSAKESGCNNFQFFTDELGTRAKEKVTLESRLQQALEKEQLFLVYQPQVDMPTGNIVGSEALLRWHHPELGLVPPDKFIPLAESNGLIISIGEWVLRAACNQAKQWQNEGLPPIPISVNVSARQFRQKDFSQLVRTVLNETGLSPQYLELELTEGLIISSAETVLVVLHQLEEMGVKLSIDDFGTGYSNLSYLRQFPLHKLKIDRSFVRRPNLEP